MDYSKKLHSTKTQPSVYRCCLVCILTAGLLSFAVSYTRFFHNLNQIFAQSTKQNQNLLAQNQDKSGEDDKVDNDEDDNNQNEEDESNITDSPDSEATSAATQSLKERIEKVVGEKEAKIQTEDSDIEYTTKGIVGQVERVSESTVGITTSKGSVIIPVDPTVELIKKAEAIKISDIEIENSIIALGIQTGETFTPIKIIISSESILPKEQIVQIAAVTKITNQSLSIQARGTGSNHKFVLNDSTNYYDASDNEIESDDLFEEIQVLIAGYAEEDEDGEKTRYAQIIKALVDIAN